MIERKEVMKAKKGPKSETEVSMRFHLWKDTPKKGLSVLIVESSDGENHFLPMETPGLPKLQSKLRKVLGRRFVFHKHRFAPDHSPIESLMATMERCGFLPKELRLSRSEIISQAPQDHRP
jgi:hypothetical protein